MPLFPLAAAQKDLPALIRRVLDGEDIVISSATHESAVRLSPVRPAFNEEVAR